MYPNLSYILHDLLGTPRDNGLAVLQTFGLFLALGTITAAYLLHLEIRRRAKLGQFDTALTAARMEVGKGASIGDYLGSALLGWLVGWKLFPLLFGNVGMAPKDFLFSSEGNAVAGVLGAALAAGYTYWVGQRERARHPKHETIDVRIEPWERSTDIAFVAGLSGLLGAKVFGILEVPPSSIQEFFRQFFSGQGLAIFGGLIAGFFGVWAYMKKYRLPFWPMADGIAPGMLIGVGVGRIGCQLSGDGDWGVDNLAPPPEGWFLPEWMWSFRYPHNVINAGVPIPGCEVEHCMQLANPVWPTPFYEIVMLVGLGLVLWVLRKRAQAWPGLLMGGYLIFNGVERFFIEKIRVNATYDILGFQPTQAEIISVVSVLLGLGLCAWTLRKGRRAYPLWV